MGGILHVILQRHDYTDTLQREDDGAEEEGPLGDRNDARTLNGSRQVGEHVDEGDHNAHKHQNIGNHREGREELEVPHQTHKDQRRRHDHYPHSDAELGLHVDPHHLLHVGGHEHQIDAAAAQQIDHQKCVHHEPDEAGPAIEGRWTVKEGLLCHIGEAHHWDLASPAQDVGALDQDVDAVGAESAHQKGGHQSKPQASVGEGHGHGQNAGAQ